MSKNQRQLKSVKEVNYEKIQYNTNPLITYLCMKTLKESAKIGKCKSSETVLDFGCGTQKLREFINAKYVGYDVVKEFSGIEDYTVLKPDKVFALGVLEYLTIKELKKTLKNFKKMNPNIELIVQLPFENLLSKAVATIFGIWKTMKDVHRIKWFQIYEELEKEFEKQAEKKLFGIIIISKWKAKRS